MGLVSQVASAYKANAAVCAKFYALTLNSAEVGSFVFRASTARPGEKALFVGGMFEVAASLIERGLDVTVVDYTDEMVSIGRERLPGTLVRKADLMSLPFNHEFDVLFVVGRVFTHMISDSQLRSALQSCYRALKPGGRLLADNYEDSRIQNTKYFNGKVECEESGCRIVRVSKTKMISRQPFVVRWDANYFGTFDSMEFNFNDSMEHRAFSREEFASKLEDEGFRVTAQGDNFDETSFYTLAYSGPAN